MLSSLFGIVLIPEEVEEEGNQYHFIKPHWIRVVPGIEYSSDLKFPIPLGPGETGAIKLALKYEESLLIVDDLAARKFAVKNGLKIIGTAGIVVVAKRAGLLSSAKDMLADLKNIGFYLDKALLEETLRSVGEF